MFIGGPCYDRENRIVCRFNKTLVTTGVYVSPEIAYCVTPPLYIVGLIQVELSLDGGKTYNYTGTFRSSKLTFIISSNILKISAKFLPNGEILS